jgi:hypothetical protein
MKDLEEAGCMEIEDNFHLKSTQLGIIINIVFLTVIMIIIIIVVTIRKDRYLLLS